MLYSPIKKENRKKIIFGGTYIRYFFIALFCHVVLFFYDTKSNHSQQETAQNDPYQHVNIGNIILKNSQSIFESANEEWGNDDNSNG